MQTVPNAPELTSRSLEYLLSIRSGHGTALY
jgi:hypothetical protein